MLTLRPTITDIPRPAILADSHPKHCPETPHRRVSGQPASFAEYAHAVIEAGGNLGDPLPGNPARLRFGR